MTLEDSGRGIMPDGDEYAIDGNFRHGIRVSIAQFQGFDAGGILRSADFLNHRIPDYRDFWMFDQPILQDFFRTQTVAAMDQGH